MKNFYQFPIKLKNDEWIFNWIFYYEISNLFDCWKIQIDVKICYIVQWMYKTAVGYKKICCPVIIRRIVIIFWFHHEGIWHNRQWHTCLFRDPLCRSNHSVCLTFVLSLLGKLCFFVRSHLAADDVWKVKRFFRLEIKLYETWLIFGSERHWRGEINIRWKYMSIWRMK